MFSKNGKKTIEWKLDNYTVLGGDKLSHLDILKLNTFYQCKDFLTLPPISGMLSYDISRDI